MRQLFLMRHAKSGWDDPAGDDFDRGLTSRGRHAAQRMSGFMQKLNWIPGEILCSAARRTRETFGLMEPLLPGIPVSYEDGLYGATRHDLLLRLRRIDNRIDKILLIGHNPGIARLTDYLAGPRGEPEALSRLRDKFPTAALAVLETDINDWAGLEEATCRLSCFIRPRDLGPRDGSDED